MHRASVAPCLAPSCKGLYGDVTTLLQRGRSCRAALRGWSAAQPQSTSSSSPALTPIAAPRLSPARQRRHTSRTPTAVAAQSAAGRQEEGERGDSEEFGAAAEAGEAAAEAAPPCIEVRLATSSDELWQAAKLRAEAYYAEDRSRFVGSLKKKFAEQELESLKVRTSRSAAPKVVPPCECLVAVAEDGAVVGCIDVRLPQAVTGVHPLGVPEGDSAACYMLNVVVAAEQRRQGIGRMLMRGAMGRAKDIWRVERMFTDVDADNAVACGLYANCGFVQHSEVGARFEGAMTAGRTLKLVAFAKQS